MKKTVKVILTIFFAIELIFAISKLSVQYANDGLVFLVIAFFMFCLHVFAWIAPKTFFNACWKITGILPDHFDYETGYKKLEIVGIGLLIAATSLLSIVFLVI